MTLIEPTLFAPVTVNTANLGFATIGTVQPFSARAGIGYQDLLETLRIYVTNDIFNAVSELGNPEPWNTTMTNLVNAIDTALATQQTNVTADLTTVLNEIAAGENAALNNATILSALQSASSTVLAFLDARTDTQTAANLGTPGSHTAQALDTLLIPKFQNGGEYASEMTGFLAKLPSIHHDFANSPNGAAPTVLDSGQAASITGTFLATVNAGALYQPSGSGAGAVSYLNTVTSKNVRRIGCEFTVESATDSGALCLAVWDSPFTTPIPPAGIHFVTTSTTWQIGPYHGQASDGFQAVANFTYKTPLQAGVTYRVEIEIDPDRGHATVKLPDGTLFEYDDPYITAHAGKNPTWEHLSGVGTSTDIPVRILRLWADDDPANEYQGLRRSQPQNLTTAQYDPQASKSTTLSAAFQVVDSVSITVPPSKKVFFHGQECLQLGGVATNTYVQTDVNGGTQYGFCDWLGLLSQDAAYHFDGILNLSAFTVGQIVTVNVSILAAATAHHQHNDSANMRNALLAIPLP